METTCLCCGMPYDIIDYQRTNALLPVVKDKQVCISCAYWVDLAERQPDNMFVIGHECFMYEKGSKHNAVYVLKNKTEVFYSRNIRNIGKVPEYLQHILPDNAQYIDVESYRIINRIQGYVCKSKGCWDRYHCFWYPLPEPYEPWNVVPPKHKIGGECCPIFINKSKINLS